MHRVAVAWLLLTLLTLFAAAWALEPAGDVPDWTVTRKWATEAHPRYHVEVSRGGARLHFTASGPCYAVAEVGARWPELCR